MYNVEMAWIVGGERGRRESLGRETKGGRAWEREEDNMQLTVSIQYTCRNTSAGSPIGRIGTCLGSRALRGLHGLAFLEHSNLMIFICLV